MNGTEQLQNGTGGKTKALESWIRIQDAQQKSLVSQQLYNPKHLFPYLALFHFFILKIVPIFQNTLKNKEVPILSPFSIPPHMHL